MNRHWRLAVHEAGHAVAHVHLGGQVRLVSMQRPKHTGGHCWLADALPPWESAIVALAGPAAELFIEDEPSRDHLDAVLRNADEDIHDFPVAQRLADEGGFSYDQAGEAAAQLVLEQWAAVEAVARPLRGARRGLMSGAKVSEIVANTRRGTAPSR